MNAGCTLLWERSWSLLPILQGAFQFGAHDDCITEMSTCAWQTEDTGYYYTTDHNYTTTWNFARDQPPATHIIIHIGFVCALTGYPFDADNLYSANDASQGVTNAQFVQVRLQTWSYSRHLLSRGYLSKQIKRSTPTSLRGFALSTQRRRFSCSLLCVYLARWRANSS